MNRCFLFSWLAACLLVFSSTSVAYGQGNNQGGGGGGQGGGNQGGGNVGGITISPDGLVEMAKIQVVPAARSRKQMRKQVEGKLSAELLKSADRRKVSLKQLNEACRTIVAQDGDVFASMELNSIAGLTRIDYIFVDFKNNDIIIAGPAEAFAYPEGATAGGRLLGVESGRPALNLEHLLTSLRLPPATDFVNCSFDPDPARLVAARNVLQSNQNPGSVDEGIGMFRRMAEVLGNWNVSVNGIPDDCRTALVMVEADYVLKRLTLGIDDPKVRGFKSQLASMKPGEDILRRWWFAAASEILETNADRTFYQIIGPRIQLFGQDELVDAEGRRTGAAVNLKSSYDYANHFSEKIEPLAEALPALADLQNIYDVMIVGAVYRRAVRDGLQLELETLKDEQKLALPRYVVAKEVPSLGNARMQGRSLLVGLVGGGVRVEPENLVNSAVFSDLVVPANFAQSATELKASQWFWDQE